MTPRTLVIWNGAARGASGRRANALRRALERQPGVVLRESRSRGQARAMAAAAAAGGVRLVLAAGGDGSVAACAAGLVGRGGATRLGVLPLGTANDVARTLGVPLEPREAFAAQREAGCVRLDVLELRHDLRRRIVVNLLAAGNGAVVTEGATQAAKRRWGHWSYLRSAAHVIRGLARWDVVLRVDERPPTSLRVITFVVANGPTAAGGLAVASGADPRDGRLDIVTVTDAPAGEIARVAARLLLDQEVSGDHVARFRGRRVRLRCGVPLPVSADGDALPRAQRLDVRVLPAALQVVALPA